MIAAVFRSIHPGIIVKLLRPLGSVSLSLSLTPKTARLFAQLDDSTPMISEETNE